MSLEKSMHINNEIEYISFITGCFTLINFIIKWVIPLYYAPWIIVCMGHFIYLIFFLRYKQSEQLICCLLDGYIFLLLHTK